MQFLYPAFLFALLALAIPIIIHLFYFRRFKKVYFTNVRFLKEVKEETSSRRRLRNLLVLAMRLLALAFLVMAFAQPFIPQKDDIKKGRQAVSIFVDNSFSMSALSEDAPLLERAKQRARQVVEAYSVEDEFQVITHDFEGRHQRLVGQEDAISLLEEIRITPAVRDLSSVLQRQVQALESGGNEQRTAYLISDFQKNITNLDQFTDTLLDIELVPLQSVQEKNISIDSAWFDAPVQMLNQTNNLLIKVRNLGQEPIENVRLSLRHEGQTKPVGTLNIPANSAEIDTVPITILRTGWHDGQLTITDYPVQFDDTYYFAFKVSEQVNILIINENATNSFLDAAFRGFPSFVTTNQLSRSLEYSKFPSYQMIVLHELKSISSGLASELKQYTANGGNVLIFPAAGADVNSYNQFLQIIPSNTLTVFENLHREVGTVNTEEFIFRDVFENKSANLKLPSTLGNFKMSNRGDEMLLTYRDGSPYISKSKVEKGSIYLCAAPLSEAYNNLVRNSEVFVPMLYKMAISSGKEQRIGYIIGRDEVVEHDLDFSGSAETVFKLKGATEEFIPQQRIVTSKLFLTVGDQLKEAGPYDLYLKPDEILGRFAFNYDRRESDLSFFTPAELEATAAESAAHISIVESNEKTNFTDLIGERSQGISLWRWCIVLTLVFLGLEGLFLRLWKV